MIQEVEYELNQKGSLEPKRPLIIEWKTERIIRNHSIRATVKEILAVMKSLDVVKIGIIGDQATGKSTLEDTLGHLIHKMSDIPFAVRAFGREEFLNIEKTLASLEPANYILKFRDLSFLTAIATRKQIDVVKQIITVIRHLRKDVKIILIYDYHYTLGLDKYLRQANFRYFTSVGSSEEDNILKIVGAKYASRIQQFKGMFVQMVTKEKATFELKKNSFFSYNYKNPFVLCLFWNEQRLRYVVFPKREWIDKLCPVCTVGEGILSDISIEDFKKEGEEKHGKGSFEAAVKLTLFSNGINTYSPTVDRALKWLTRSMEKNQISFDALANSYGLDLTKSRLRKQLYGVLEDEKNKSDINLIEEENIPKKNEEMER